MPSTSAKQAKFMRAVANSPKFAKKVGVPQSVGKDFEMADKKRKKFSEGGRAERMRDRRMADIESDYKKALARGKSEKEARAKRAQREADARDDYAKRTGADRTETRAAEKAAEARLSAARRSPDKDMKPVSVTAEGSKPLTTAKVDMPKVEAPKVGASSGKQTFAQAFADARKGGAKTFTWGGKSYTTEMRGERKPAASARAAAPAAGNTSATRYGANFGKPEVGGKANKTPATPPKTPAPDKPAAPKLTQSQKYTQMAARSEQEAAQKRAQEKPLGQGGTPFARLKNLVGFGSDAATRRAQMYRGMAAQEDKRTATIARLEAADAAADKARAAAKAKRNAEIIAAGEKPGASGYERGRAKFYRENPNAMRKGGKVKKYAKGGKIDGIAVRGKTRAKRKK